jgi:ribose transport system permease protein
MSRVFGVSGLLIVLYCLLYFANPQVAFRNDNIIDLLNQQAYYGVITVGVGVLIITGGIDLSIGAVVGLSAIAFPMLIKSGIHPVISLGLVLLIGVVIGLIHGILITQLKLQPFLVTLCGLFIYRGIGRILTGDIPVGFSQITKAHPEFMEVLEKFRQIFIGKYDSNLTSPNQAYWLLLIALFLGIILHATKHGRAWYALGFNEQASRYAGIRTNRHRLFVYVICSTLSSFAGVLLFLNYSSAQPVSSGQNFELYAITGAVLGGCSLRGGEGNIFGMVLGAAVLPLLENLMSFLGSTEWWRNSVGISVDTVIPVFIGLTLLLGSIVDEYFRRRGKSRR